MADDRPGTLTDLVSAGTAAWGNWVVKHGVPVFTTTAARTAGIAAPTVGAVCYMATGDNTTEGLYRYHATAGWVGVGTHRCTAATRPATPFVGMEIFETDTFKKLVYYGATTGWRPYWSEPWGVLVAPLTTTTASATVTTTETVVSTNTAAPVVANRLVRVSFTTTYVGSVATDLFNATIRANNLTGTICVQARIPLPGASIQQFYSVVTDFTTVTTGNLPFVNTIQRAAGTGNMGIIAGLSTKWIVEDMGPASGVGPPSP